jgi:2-keto-4-pentenoate hydratase
MRRDERIEAGMRAALARRDERVRAGERQIGWKLGFGAPAAMEELDLDRPLVGFLTDAGLVEVGATVSVRGWTGAVLEVEIAARLGRDLAPDASWEEARAAIGGLAACIELADVDGPRDDVEAILAANIFHRHVVLGRFDDRRSTAEGISASVLRDGREIAATDEPTALTGELVEVVRQTAELLGGFGERLSTGDVVITGTVVPGQPIAPDQRVEARMPPLGALSLQLV